MTENGGHADFLEILGNNAGTVIVVSVVTLGSFIVFATLYKAYKDYPDLVGLHTHSLPPFLQDIQDSLSTQTTAEVAGLTALGPDFRVLLEGVIGTPLPGSPNARPLVDPVPTPPYPVNEVAVNVPFTATPGATGLSISDIPSLDRRPEHAGDVSVRSC